MANWDSFRKILFVLPLFLPLFLKAEDIVLKPGQTAPMNYKGRAWVEKAKVIRLQETASGFTLKGVSPGNSLLRMGEKTFQISVLSPAQERAWLNLTEPVAKSLGLSLSVANGTVRVKGRLLRWEEWEKIYKACALRDCDFSMEAQMPEELRNKARKKISELFQQNGLPPQNLTFDRRIQALVSSKGETSQQVTRLLKALGITVIPTSSNLDLEPLIRIQITIAEVRKSESLKYGIEWPQSYQAQILPKTAVANDASLTVRFLENQGLAKVLASPNILCRSGKEANFFAGGEFPIKILNYKMQDVVWKKYGIALKVKPKADFSGKMSISIETEVSSIDPATAVDHVPGLLTNQIQSHFDLNESRLIALSGLIKSDQSNNSQGLPGLSRIPILGALFSSKDFNDNRTELVVFVKPEVISPGSLEAEP